MSPPLSVPVSVLDLAPVGSGSTSAAALRASLELVQVAERLGYHRYWVAEHHNMPGIASSAPAVLIAHLGTGCRICRTVGRTFDPPGLTLLHCTINEPQL